MHSVISDLPGYQSASPWSLYDFRNLLCSFVLDISIFGLTCCSCGGHGSRRVLGGCSCCSCCSSLMQSPADHTGLPVVIRLRCCLHRTAALWGLIYMSDTGICSDFGINNSMACDCAWAHAIGSSRRYLATMGVSPIVIGARTGIRALLHRKASAMDELGPVRRLLNHPLSFGFASSWTCWSACSSQAVRQVPAGLQCMGAYLRGAHT